jgi:endonuclease G, mitochondrial
VGFPNVFIFAHSQTNFSQMSSKFRTNHNRQGGGASAGMIIRVGLFGAIISGLFFLFNLFMGDSAAAEAVVREEGEYYLPTSTTNAIVRHKYFTLSYAEAHEQAEWVAYRLTREELNAPWVSRTNNFQPDPKVKTGSATPDDYRNSGYDRGHLLPAADRAFSEEAMSETFYMSNISPQASNFNKGVWRELEELTRSWAKRDKQLYVVTGPVLKMPVKGAIGANKVSVPAAYFKVLLDLEEPIIKGIGFVIPNEISFEPLHKFAVSIDEVEELTGIDFFVDLMPKALEVEVEKSFNLDLWEFSKQKYQQRIEKWNNE